MNKFNINTRCRVELTEYGVQILQEHRLKKYNLLIRKNGKIYYESELWEIMAIFGECHYMGNINQPFVDNILELSDTW